MGGSSSIPFQEEMHVVVVGGGYGGVPFAMSARKICKVTIIDPKDSMVHNVAALRACVEADFAKNIFIPYEKTFGDSFVRGKVVSINKDANFVTLDDGKEIHYTHLVLATGAGSPFPGKVTTDYPNVSKEEGVNLYKSLNKEITSANTIVCVGGGAVGVELSGEIKTDFPDKNVILIHSRDVLCSDKLLPKTQKALQANLKKKGVNVMLQTRVTNLSEVETNKCIKQVLKTEDGQEIEADLVLPCIGIKLATEVFQEALGESMTEKGQIKVDQYFKVLGTENIYAIGDITDIVEEKMAYAASNHANLLVKNLEAEFAGRATKPYKPGAFLMIIPVGRNGGAGQLYGMTIGDFACKMIKSKDVFVPKYWKEMGQAVPK